MNTYTLTAAEHATWYSGNQPEADALRARLRATLPPNTEIYDRDGIVCDIMNGGRHEM